MDQTYPTPIIHIKHIGNFTFGPVYPVINHTLALFKSQARDMEMITLMETCDGVFKLKDRELELNTEYSFHVVVTNSVGSVQSTPVQIGKY